MTSSNKLGWDNAAGVFAFWSLLAQSGCVICWVIASVLLWNETVFKLFNVFMCFHKVYVLFWKVNFHILWFLNLFYFLLLVLYKCFERNLCFTMQIYPDISMCCCCWKNLWLILFGVLTSVFSLNYNNMCHYVCVRSRWSSNPHFRGAYSFRSMVSETLQAFASHLAEPLTNDNKKPVCMFYMLLHFWEIH